MAGARVCQVVERPIDDLWRTLSDYRGWRVRLRNVADSDVLPQFEPSWRASPWRSSRPCAPRAEERGAVRRADPGRRHGPQHGRRGEPRSGPLHRSVPEADVLGRPGDVEPFDPDGHDGGADRQHGARPGPATRAGAPLREDPSPGHGAHRCVGAYLAREEADAVLRVVAPHLPDFELTGEPLEIAESQIMQGFRRIPLVRR